MYFLIYLIKTLVIVLTVCYNELTNKEHNKKNKNNKNKFERVAKLQGGYYEKTNNENVGKN